MENIRNFDEWIKINEGINVNVNSDDDKIDEITIDGDITYTIDDKNNVQNNNEQISDEKLKEDIKDADCGRQNYRQHGGVPLHTQHYLYNGIQRNNRRFHRYDDQE